MHKKKMMWRRLIWVIFISLYSILFFYNFFRPFNNWQLSYLYTIVLVIWLCVEYYEKHLFFQSGLLLHYHGLLRASFALLFYSSFVIGLATIIWWQSNRIDFYPYIQILGLGLLLYSIYLRRRVYAVKELTEDTVSKFYLSLSILVISIALAYSSMFLIPYAVIIGLVLIVIQKRYERNHLKDYEKFINSAKDYSALQQKYLEYIEEQFNKRGKK